MGGRYGVPSAAGNAAVRWLAQAEGILLDPVYTGKAFAGLLDLAENGAIQPDELVIFRHTGDLPALFASRVDHREQMAFLGRTAMRQSDSIPPPSPLFS